MVGVSLTIVSENKNYPPSTLKDQEKRKGNIKITKLHYRFFPHFNLNKEMSQNGQNTCLSSNKLIGALYSCQSIISYFTQESKYTI